MAREQPAALAPLEASIPVGAELADLFTQTISARGLRRWETDLVRFSLRGDVSAVDRRVLTEALETFASVPGVPELVLVREDSPAEVLVYITTRDRWAEIFESGATIAKLPAGGLTISSASDGRLVRATVAVDSAADQVVRSRALVHETLHALGLHHNDCATGLVYGGTDDAPGWVPGELDLALLTMTYDQVLPAGSSAREVRSWLRPEPGLGPTCAPQQWVEVGPWGGPTFWCRLDIGDCQSAVDNHVGGPVFGASTVARLEDGRLISAG